MIIELVISLILGIGLTLIVRKKYKQNRWRRDNQFIRRDWK